MARILVVTPAMINQLMKGSRPVPIEHCLAIEQATEGKVTRQDLRPNDFWKIWPDLTHLAQPTEPTTQQEGA
jgi:DNA-binding transcriptional regulator YdaS (Cro superfamily)